MLVKQAPVLCWRTYNLTVEKYHTYIAGGCRVHNDCLLDGEELLPESLRVDSGGYSLDVFNPTTGLVTTIDHTYAPDTGQEFLSRRTFIPDTDAYLSASWGTFNDAYQPIGPAAYTVNWAGGTQTLGPLPDGVTVAPGRAVVEGQEFGTLNIIDPATSQVLQSVGVTASPTNPADTFLMTAQYDATGQYDWSQKAQVIDTAGTVVRTQVTIDSGTTVSQSRNPAAAADDPKAWQPTVVRDPWGNEIAGGEIGSILGSSIGNAIAGGNVFGQIAASSVLGALLQNVGQTFGYALDHNVSLESAAYTTVRQFDTNLAQQVHSAGLGALTSYLTAELAESLGIHSTDFGGQLFSYAASTGINTILDYAIGNVARARAAAALAHPRQALVPGPARSGSHVGCGAAANDNGAWTYILAA